MILIDNTPDTMPFVMSQPPESSAAASVKFHGSSFRDQVFILLIKLNIISILV